MPTRLIRVLQAGGALLLVAGSLDALSRPSRPPSHHVVLAPLRPSTTAAPSTTPTTAATTTTRSVAATTTTKAAPTTVTATTQPALDAGHRWAVAVTTLTFVDTSRPTPPAGNAAGTGSRTLTTIVRYPADGPAAAPETQAAAPSHVGGPFPLIVFAHGYNSSPAVYAALLHDWTSAGYVVAAPEFPRALAGGPLDESDLDQQPRDLAFVITRLLATGSLSGVIDPGHIGVAGHSDGGDAALGVGYDTCCRDPRIAAGVAMGVDEHAFPGGIYFPSGTPPLLVVQADHDSFNPPRFGDQVYADARSPKYLLSLINATHLESVTTDQAHLAVVVAATLGFFDRYLKGRADGVARLRQAAVAPLATLTAG